MVSARRTARAGGRHAAPKEERPGRPLWVEALVFVLVTVLIAFLLKTFLVGVYFIPSGSMENTLAVGDRVVVDKLTYDFRDIGRGDVVVFNGADSFTPEGTVAAAPSNPVARALRVVGGVVGLAPADERDFVKRVIGVAGDRVVCCDARGRITVNGVALDEADYLYPGNVASTTRFDVRVPEGKLWVMGDHRSASADSRSRIGKPGGGFVPVDRVIGRARFVVWPFGNIRRLATPDTFDRPALSGG